MTDYLTYTPAEYAPDAPATALHFQRWFENWRAGFEGAAGAPRLQDAALDTGASTAAGRAWVAARVIDPGAGGVGTYALLRTVSGTSAITAGATLAGSSLQYSSTSNFSGGTLTGTWRAMGSRGAGTTDATLFQRIA
ncbi:hypothetical protein HYN69_10545 [Gemmobacter aquarius]|uniref:Uncharacterized protein n=1 Tax=Paragemmobacter aquarius TaxID=2169400 RepID=A0A2S0UM48_9RHOB|nr:hypothetical protein [Gemmobacter aquarius]AWB48882.1 hypothetical protein HYN69_10545 [Gemmobacter aquarius]